MAFILKASNISLWSCPMLLASQFCLENESRVGGSAEFITVSLDGGLQVSKVEKHRHMGWCSTGSLCSNGFMSSKNC